MKLWIVAAAIGALSLAGCQKPGETPPSSMGGFHSKGRYFGVGLYPAGRMWEQVVSAEAAKNPAAAQPKDDEQVIVVLDSATGELRQCGNLSGACIAMNPWSKPLVASHQAPVLVGKHAGDLDRENDEADAAAARQGQAQIRVRVKAK